jgi:hypothetical protein
MLVVNVASEGKGVSSRNAIAQVMETYQDGSAMVQWRWNSKKLDGSASAAYFPVWYTPEAKLGETASLIGEMPLWEMVPRRDMAVAFMFDSECRPTKEGGIPLLARFIAKSEAILGAGPYLWAGHDPQSKGVGQWQ